MGTKKIFSVIIFCFVVLIAYSSCGRSEWAEKIDMTSITKTTKYAMEKDGVTPLKSQVGTVKMSHKAHDEAGIDCVVCHHKEFNDDREKECAKCHTGNDGYTTMHNLCLNCHIEKKKGPQDCKNCH